MSHVTYLSFVISIFQYWLGFFKILLLVILSVGYILVASWNRPQTQSIENCATATTTKSSPTQSLILRKKALQVKRQPLTLRRKPHRVVLHKVTTTSSSMQSNNSLKDMRGSEGNHLNSESETVEQRRQLRQRTSSQQAASMFRCTVCEKPLHFMPFPITHAVKVVSECFFLQEQLIGEMKSMTLIFDASYSETVWFLLLLDLP